MIGVDKAPPRLHHSTLKDAAFNIFQERMIAGYGDSGKLRNYFAEETLEELNTRAGVRDRPVEIVLDTLYWLRNAGFSGGHPHEGQSVGQRHPRDTRTRCSIQDDAAQKEEEDEEMERPAPAEAVEVSPRASSPAAASTDQVNVRPVSTPRVRGEVNLMYSAADKSSNAAVLRTHHFRAVYLPTLQQRVQAHTT